MDTLDRATLAELAQPVGWPAVSIYLPSNRLPRNGGEGRLRFKNLVKEATDKLTSEGMSASEAEAVIRPLHGIRDDDTFWRDTADALAVFLSRTGVRTLRLSITVPEQAVVGDRFYLRPLAAAHLKTDNRFYALALDKGGVRLFSGDRGSIQEIDLPNVPRSLDESAKFDVPTKLQSASPFSASRKHAGNAGTGSPTGGAFPGHGSERDYEFDQLQLFIRQVESGIDSVLGRAFDRPLAVLGPERVVAEYANVSRYPITTEGNMKLNASTYAPQAVQEWALTALDDYFEQQTRDELALVTESEGTDLVTRDAETIASAAAVGRVKTLFFDDGVGPFGTFDRASMEAHAVCDVQPRLLREAGDSEKPLGGDCGWDLIDLALAETVLHDGEIHIFQGEDAPLHGAVALLRY